MMDEPLFQTFCLDSLFISSHIYDVWCHVRDGGNTGRAVTRGGSGEAWDKSEKKKEGRKCFI